MEKLANAAQKSLGTTLSTPPLDIVYLDPPWEAEAEYTTTLHLLASARGRHILAPDALVIAEHSSKVPLAARFGDLRQTRALKQGDAALTFYALTSEQS
jgi:16S rRNA G966 N2-methylase RsmD